MPKVAFPPPQTFSKLRVKLCKLQKHAAPAAFRGLYVHFRQAVHSVICFDSGEHICGSECVLEHSTCLLQRNSFDKLLIRKYHISM